MRRYRWLPPTPGHTIQVAGATYAHGDDITTETALEHPWLTELETATGAPGHKQTLNIGNKVAALAEALSPKNVEALMSKKARPPKKLEE